MAQNKQVRESVATYRSWISRDGGPDLLCSATVERGIRRALILRQFRDILVRHHVIEVVPDKTIKVVVILSP